jgi:lysozyme
VVATITALTAAVANGCLSAGVDILSDKLAPGLLVEASPAMREPRTELRPIHDKGIALTKVSEGFVPKLYHDAARYCTIGYGHLLKRAPCDGTEPEHFRRGITEEHGTKLLVQDLSAAQRAVTALVAVDLTDGQYAALCDFVFNVGTGNFKASTLLRVLNEGQTEHVPDQFRRWILAGGKPWPGLVARREGEVALFFDGMREPRSSPGDQDLSPIDIRRGE